MATTYYAPGVYIEEVDKGTKPIQGVATSVTAFIGFTQKAEKPEADGLTTRSILGKPTLITNWGQYEQHFGSFHKDAYLPYAVRGFFDNGGTRCYVTSVFAMESHRAQRLVKGRDRQQEKDIPVLLIKAAKGGKEGNAITVQLMPLIDEDVSMLSDKQRKEKRYKAVINGAVIEELSLSYEEEQQAEMIARQESDIATLEQEINQMKEGWKSKGIDLEATGAKWVTLKEEHPDIDLEAIKSELTNKDQKLKQAKEHLGADQKRLSEQKSGKNQEQSEDDAALIFSLDNLPFLSEAKGEEQRWRAWRKEKEKAKANPNNNRKAATPAPGSYIDQKERKIPVEIWKLHKQGPESIVLPKTDETFTLEHGTLKFDFELLEAKGQWDETKLATSSEADFFTANSRTLYLGDEPKRLGINGHFAYEDVNLVCAPDIMKAYDILDNKDDADTIVQGIQEAILTFCKRAHYPFAILDTPPDKGVQEIADWRMELPGGDTMHGALYYPWIKITDPFDAKRKISIPPCGHIAGIYARSDNERGVHKAPANELVSGAIDLALKVTKNEQELLNPMGVNCIRQFPGRGIRVWGARTLAMTDPSWRYINVRRLFSYVEASVERSTQWIVFEPNDHILWAKVRRDITAFLRTVWLSGALFGVTPEQSFYVKCDEETNLPELRDLGQMVCEIGMAPVKPAEFVIFRFSQWAAESDV